MMKVNDGWMRRSAMGAFLGCFELNPFFSGTNFVLLDSVLMCSFVFLVPLFGILSVFGFLNFGVFVWH